MAKTEEPRLPSRFTIPPAGWAYGELKGKYMELYELCQSYMLSAHHSHLSAVSFERVGIAMAQDLETMREMYRRCHNANRTTDGQFVEPTFEELNTPVVPTPTVIDAENE